MDRINTRRKLLLALALLLTLSLAFALVQAEEAPMMEVVAPEETVFTAYLDGDFSLQMWHIWVDNTAEMNAYYGTIPEYTVTHLAGDESIYTVDVDTYDTGASAYILLNNDEIGSTGDTTFRLAIDWEGQTWSEEFTIRVKALDFQLPELVYEDVTIDVGDSITIDQSALSDPDWEVPAEVTIAEYWRESAFPTYSGTTATSTLTFRSGSERLAYTITANGPGVYPVRIHYDISNLRITGDFLINVRDASGAVPQPVLEIDVEEVTNVIYTDGVSGNVLWNQYVKNSRYLNLLYGAEPVWTIECLYGEEDVYAAQIGDAYCSIVSNKIPAGAGSTILSVECNVGRLSWYNEYMIDVCDRDFDLPTLSCSELMLTVGDRFAFTRDWLQPSGWQLPDGVDTEWVRYETDAEMGVEVDYIAEGAGFDKTFIALEAGVYHFDLTYGFANYYIRDRLTVYVADENGNVPEELAISLSNDYADERSFYIGGEVMDTIALLRVENYSELYFLIDGEPVWTTEVLSGDASMLHMFGGSDVLQIYSAEAPTRTDDVEILCTCTWGSLTASKTIRMHLKESPVGLPVGLNWPDEVVLQPDETFTLSASDVLPSGWAIEGETMRLSGYRGGSGAVDFIVYSDYPTCQIVARQSGIDYVNVRWQCANIVLEKNVVVRVTDENGNVPETELTLYQEIHTPDVYVGGDAYTHLGYVTVENSNLMSKLLDGKPEWDYITSGVDDSFIKADFSEYGVGFYLQDDAPVETGTVAITGICWWGDLEATATIFLNVQEPEMGAPTGLDVPEELVLSVGESHTFTMKDLALPAGWDLGNDAYGCTGYIELGTVGYGLASLEFEYDDNWNVAAITLTADASGAFPAMFTWRCANYQQRQGVIIRIADADGKLPEADMNLYDVEENLLVCAGARNLCLGDVWLDGNMFHAYKDIYGGLPTWTITCSDDSAVFTTQAIGEAIHDEVGMGFRLIMTQAPATPGEVTYTIHGRWGKITHTSTHSMTVLELPTLDLPDDLLTIGEEAFAGVDAEHLVIPAGTTSIGARAFANCYALRFVQIPASVTSIAADAFEHVYDWIMICEPGSCADEFAQDYGVKIYYMD